MVGAECVQGSIQTLQTLLIFVLAGASAAAVGCARAVTASLETLVNRFTFTSLVSCMDCECCCYRNAQAEQRHLATTMALATTTVIAG